MDYALITVAWNEQEFIEKTILSVTKQTIIPKKWVIFNDGSTDKTEQIIGKYISLHQWIELISIPPHHNHGFSSKADGFMTAYKNIQNLGFEIIGNLDADISFESDYFEFLLGKFIEDPKLGVAGTPFVEDNKHYDYRFASVEHVSGACQLFRRECFDQIGGYKPIKEGGIDWVAVTTARMMGWKTRTFLEKVCYHHRKIGTANKGFLHSIFHYGKKNYLLGYHPVWQMMRIIYQGTKKPIILGGICLMVGYLWGFITIRKRPVDILLIKYFRQEQMLRLKSIFKNVVRLKI